MIMIFTRQGYVTYVHEPRSAVALHFVSGVDMGYLYVVEATITMCIESTPCLPSIIYVFFGSLLALRYGGLWRDHVEFELLTSFPMSDRAVPILCNVDIYSYKHIWGACDPQFQVC